VEISYFFLQLKKRHYGSAWIDNFALFPSDSFNDAAFAKRLADKVSHQTLVGLDRTQTEQRMAFTRMGLCLGRPSAAKMKIILDSSSNLR